MNINPIAQNLAIKIKPYQIKIELILLSVIIIGVLLKNSEIGNTLILIPFNLLAILYFIMAFRVDKPENPTTIFLNRLIQLSFSVAMMAILFAIQHYQGAAMMMRISMISMFVGFVYLLITKLKKKEQIIDPDVIRIVIITLLITTLVTTNKFEFLPEKNIDTEEITKDKNIP